MYFIDEKAVDELMLLMSDDIDFIDREYKETRSSSQEVLKRTEQYIKIFQEKLQRYIDTLTVPDERIR